jgi:hypothetical protein
MLQQARTDRSPLRTGPRGAGARFAQAIWPLLKLAAPPLALFMLWFACASTARAQRSGDFGMTYTQERSNFVANTVTPEFFYLRGASVDLGYSLWRGFGISGSGIGLAGTNLNGNIDIHHVQFLIGPRYTYNLGHITPTAWNRKGGIFVEGKIGYTFATAGQYPVNGVLEDHASALTYAGGGGINLHIYHRFDLRLIEADYVRTQLPNGSDNVQNTLRLASGINFHIGN